MYKIQLKKRIDETEKVINLNKFLIILFFYDERINLIRKVCKDYFFWILIFNFFFPVPFQEETVRKNEVEDRMLLFQETIAIVISMS